MKHQKQILFNTEILIDTSRILEIVLVRVDHGSWLDYYLQGPFGVRAYRARTRIQGNLDKLQTFSDTNKKHFN